MFRRDGVTAYQAGSHHLAYGSEARIPTVYPWLLWIEREAIGADWHASASTNHQTLEDETGNRVKEKAPDPFWVGRLDVVRTSGGQVLKTLPVTTKGPTERTGFQLFRREVEDTAGFRRLGTVEPATECAREHALRIQAVRVTSFHGCLGPGERVGVNGTFKRGQADQVHINRGLGQVRHQARGSV